MIFLKLLRAVNAVEIKEKRKHRMLSYTNELTMSHVGLGALNEYGLLIAFGNAHSKALVDNLSITPSEIVDNNDQMLYPAYFMTHVKTPPNLPLHQYNLWNNLQVGIAVKRFGDTLLESNYIIKHDDDENDTPIENLLNQRISMQANSLFVVDASVAKTTDRQAAVPKHGCLAEMKKLTKPPAVIKRARDIRANGFADEADMEQIQTGRPIQYDLIPGRDVQPGHAMIFAKFSEIMDFAEFTLLTKHVSPGISLDLHRYIQLLERETYYYGNCFAGEKLNIFMKGKLEACEPDFHGGNLRIISGGVLTFVIEIYQEKNNTLLSIAKVKKLIALPIQVSDMKCDIERNFLKK